MEGKLLLYLNDLNLISSHFNMKLVKMMLGSINQLISERGKSYVASYCPMVFTSTVVNEKVKQRVLVFCFDHEVELKNIDELRNDLMYAYSNFIDHSKELLSIQNYKANEILYGKNLMYYTSDENPEMNTESRVLSLYMMLNNVGMVLNYQKVKFNDNLDA